MFPLFHNQTFFHNNDPIRIRNGRQAVGNGDHCTTLACAGQREKVAGSTTTLMLRQGSSRRKAIDSCTRRARR